MHRDYEGLRIRRELFRQPVTPEDVHYIDCSPDLYVTDLLELQPDDLAAMGVRHVLFDLDGTIVPLPTGDVIDDTILAYLHQIHDDKRFDSMGLATDNRGYLEQLALSIGPNTRLFQPIEHDDPAKVVYKYSPAFYLRILSELGCTSTPHEVAMVGDSPKYDILPAQGLGLRTVLVDRLNKRYLRY